MPTNDLQPIPMDAVSAGSGAETARWLWDGFLHPGDVTLLTSQWKTGKTTTLCGLLQQLGDGRPFLGRATRPAKAWVVSEESPSVWAERLAVLPVGAHTKLLARPFRGRPTVGQWNQLLERAFISRFQPHEKLRLVDVRRDAPTTHRHLGIHRTCSFHRGRADRPSPLDAVPRPPQ